MKNIDVKRKQKRKIKRRKSFFVHISLIVLVILCVLTIKVSFEKTKIKTNSYLSNKVTKSGQKHKAYNSQKSNIKKDNVKNDSVVLKNQISDSGTKAEDAFNEDGKKTAYLTFDDGPSTTVTPQILDALKANGVHATFFLVGSAIEKTHTAGDLVRRIYDEGNAIGNHTYTHNIRYDHNTVDVDSFMNELDRTENVIKNILGPTFFTRVIRMPGGRMSRVHYKDPNLPKLDEAFKQNNMVSIDWNAYDFDAEGKRKYADELFQNVKREVKGKNKVVILMHDTYGKEQTAKALPNIIQYLKEQGYEFGTLK